MRISLTLDDITNYIFNALVINELASLDVSQCYHLLPDVFHLDGHILGTKNNIFIYHNTDKDPRLDQLQRLPSR